MDDNCSLRHAPILVELENQQERLREALASVKELNETLQTINGTVNELKTKLTVICAGCAVLGSGVVQILLKFVSP